MVAGRLNFSQADPLSKFYANFIVPWLEVNIETGTTTADT